MGPSALVWVTCLVILLPTLSLLFRNEDSLVHVEIPSPEPSTSCGLGPTP